MAACLYQLRSGQPVSRIVMGSQLNLTVYREEDAALLVGVGRTLESGREGLRSALSEPAVCPYDRRASCDLRLDRRLKALFDEMSGLLSTDPVIGYLQLLWLKEELEAEIRLDKSCRACLARVFRFVSEFVGRLKRTALIRKFEDASFPPGLISREAVYARILRPLNLFREADQSRLAVSSIGRVLDLYSVPPYEVSILDVSAPPGTILYSVRPDVSDPRVLGLVGRLSRMISRSALSDRRLVGSLDRLISSRLEIGRRLVYDHTLRLNPDDAERVVRLAVYRSLGLGSLMPFLLDESVEEVFVDAPGTPLYLDHRRWGRCVTRVFLSPREMVALKTRLRSESGMRLDALNPSLKADVSTRDFLCRFSLDVQPLANEGFSLDVRKLRKRHFTLPELVANGTIPVDAAAYLYFCLIRGRSITVVGEPKSGKTTLINALDLLTPASWRKIAVEDVVESVPQWLMGAHQVRLRVEPLESMGGESRSKSVEIVKLLHRAPDWIYLGEVQTAEHSRAMFHALSAGLRGLQTCHAGSPEQALRRWVVHHGVSPVCMLDLDVLVQTARLSVGGRETRRVVRVCEVRGLARAPYEVGVVDLGRWGVQLCSVFAWCPDGSSLSCTSDLFDTPVLRKIREVEALDSASFWEEFGFYKRLLERLCFLRVFDADSCVKVFQALFEERREQRRAGCPDWTSVSNAISRLTRRAVA